MTIRRLVAVAARGRWARGGRLRDLRSSRRDDVPFGAEGLELFAVRLALLRVLDEGVERVSVVGNLHPSVCALRGAEERCLDTVRCERLAGRDQRRPERRALPVAGALVVLVLREQIERASARVDEDPSQAGR